MPILTGQARIAGILGWPAGHSRSPRLHGFWLERYGIDGTYIPLPVRPDDFPDAVRGLVRVGFAGANVTAPHKLAAFAICDRVDPSAQRAGAVNTLVFEKGRIAGSNTDGWGFMANLGAHGIDPKAGPALILGAGGAARAIAAALLQEGVEVTVTNRTASRAEELARQLPGLSVMGWDRRSDGLGGYALVANATSLGMSGHPPLSLELERAQPGLAVADIVYVPLETPLLMAARQRGLRTAEGLGMLLHQAVPGFRAWFGIEPKVDDSLRSFVAADLLAK